MSGEPPVRAVRGTVDQGGRRKAYRPLPDVNRRAAFDAAMAAYGRGDFFEAHELLEPAWMGTDDPLERELHQGLIKLAAAFVHGVRGNRLGVGKNLRGARQRLGTVAEGGGPTGGIDLTALLAAIDARLERLGRDPAAFIDPPPIPRTRA